jgi:hypothetical protein
MPRGAIIVVCLYLRYPYPRLQAPEARLEAYGTMRDVVGKGKIVTDPNDPDIKELDRSDDWDEEE